MGTKVYYVDEKYLKMTGEYIITDGVCEWGPIKPECVGAAIDKLCWGDNIPTSFLVDIHGLENQEK